MDTEALIAALAEDARPVRRLRPAWQRAAIWLALGLPPLLLIAALDGIRIDVAAVFQNAATSIEFVAIIATAVTAAISAFVSTVPGQDRKWLFAPILPLAVWLAHTGKTCIEDLTRFGIDGLLLRVDGPCVPAMVAMSVVPIAGMLLMLRHGALLHPRSTLMLGALAVAALTNLGLRLIHEPDISIQAIVWSFAAVGLLSVFLSRSGTVETILRRHR